MGGNCLNGGSNCQPVKGGSDNGSPLGWGGWNPWGFTFAPWPAPIHHSTGSNIRPSSTIQPAPSSIQSKPSNKVSTSAIPRTTYTIASVLPSATVQPASRASASSSLQLTILSTKPLTITALSMQTTPKPLSQASLQSVITASAKLSSVLALSISSYPIPSRPSNTAKGVFQTTISAEAASKIADFTSTEDPQPVESHKVVPVVVGILLGVILLVVPFVLFMYRRRQRVQHRRSIGGIEKDTFARPWEKSEMKLRRKTANMESLYPAEKRPRELLMPEPIFAPLRPNRSSSLYTGSILNSLEHLSSDIEQPKAWYPGRTDIGNNQNGNYVLARQASRPYSNPEFSETQPIQRNSGYEYYDDPFRTPLYSPASIITKV